jgi:hypothetical protein
LFSKSKVLLKGQNCWVMKFVLLLDGQGIQVYFNCPKALYTKCTWLAERKGIDCVTKNMNIPKNFGMLFE